MKKTNNLTISRKSLLKYLEKEQVAFQFVDGLIKFTQLDSDGYDDLEDEKDVTEIKQVIEHCTSLNVVDSNEMRNMDLGFDDIVDWARPQDLLLLVDNTLILCLPNKDILEEAI